MIKKLTHETWRMIDTISLQGPSAYTMRSNDEKMRITLRDEPDMLEDVKVLVKGHATGVIAVRVLAKQLHEGDGDEDGKGWWEEEMENK